MLSKQICGVFQKCNVLSYHLFIHFIAKRFHQGYEPFHLDSICGCPLIVRAGQIVIIGFDERPLFLPFFGGNPIQFKKQIVPTNIPLNWNMRKIGYVQSLYNLTKYRIIGRMFEYTGCIADIAEAHGSLF